VVTDQLYVRRLLDVTIRVGSLPVRAAAVSMPPIVRGHRDGYQPRSAPRPPLPCSAAPPLRRSPPPSILAPPLPRRKRSQKRSSRGDSRLLSVRAPRPAPPRPRPPAPPAPLFSLPVPRPPHPLFPFPRRDWSQKPPPHGDSRLLSAKGRAGRGAAGAGRRGGAQARANAKEPRTQRCEAPVELSVSYS